MHSGIGHMDNGIDHMGSGIDHMGSGIDHMGSGIDHMGSGIDHMRSGTDHMGSAFITWEVADEFSREWTTISRNIYDKNLTQNITQPCTSSHINSNIVIYIQIECHYTFRLGGLVRNYEFICPKELCS